MSATSAVISASASVYEAGEEDVGARLDAYLVICTNFSRSYIQNLIKNEQIFVNGKHVKAGEKLKKGDKIKVLPQAPKGLDVVAENIPIDIVYEDKDLLVVNKEKGMVVHPAPGHDSGTLVNALLYHCESLSGINGTVRPGIVHRIDKDTSGLLVVAKNDAAHRGLSEQLASHAIERAYVAIAFGKIKEDCFTINAGIGRNPVHRKKMAVTDRGSKPAITNIEVLGRFFYKNTNYTHIKARLQTGRTHQIRVHMAHVGHPLVGDRVYGYEKQPFKTDGQVLHALELGFRHPVTGEQKGFVSPLPPYFVKILRDFI
ncbi:MAG: RluA family pseudouridine synthase [Defluviitaleaceae bacterium]|nr:RluA family pseudouridine synthase [Defluviitaleaceae bacterium]